MILSTDIKIECIIAIMTEIKYVILKWVEGKNITNTHPLKKRQWKWK